MKLLDSSALQNLMAPKDSDSPNIPRDYDYLGIESFTHIAKDAQTLRSLAIYTEEAARNGGSILNLSSLEEISAAALMIFLRHDCIGIIHLESLKSIDLPCIRILLKSLNQNISWISLGFGFSLSDLDPEVLAEISMSSRYGWTHEGNFYLKSEVCFQEDENENHWM